MKTQITDSIDDTGTKITTTTTPPITNEHNRKGDGNLKALERRYHLLYLRAIEVQCLLEGLLGRKESSVSYLHKHFYLSFCYFHFRDYSNT